MVAESTTVPELELPPILESFGDGTNYHGVVNGFFPQFARNKWRATTCWSHPDTGPRWMVHDLGQVKPGPVAWVPTLPK